MLGEVSTGLKKLNQHARHSVGGCEVNNWAQLARHCRMLFVSWLVFLVGISCTSANDFRVFKENLWEINEDGSQNFRYDLKTHRNALGLNKQIKLTSKPLQDNACHSTFLNVLHDSAASRSPTSTLACAGVSASYVNNEGIEGWLVTDTSFFPELFGHGRSSKILNKYYIDTLQTGAGRDDTTLFVKSHDEGLIVSTDAMIFFVLRLDLDVQVHFTVNHGSHRQTYELGCSKAKGQCQHIQSTVTAYFDDAYLAGFVTSLSKTIDGYADVPDSGIDKHFVASFQPAVQALEPDKRIKLIKGSNASSSDILKPFFMCK